MMFGMRRWLVVLAFVVACKNADGEVCSSYDDCSSGICGGGICLGGKCPCDDGWECVTDYCGLFSCPQVCREICVDSVNSSDCPGDQVCQVTQDEDNPRHCRYARPTLYAMTTSYTATAGETLTIEVRIEPFPKGWAIINPSFVGATNLGPPRITMPNVIAQDITVQTTTTVIFESLVREIVSAEDPDEQFSDFVMTNVPVTVVQ
jgi:hypothetical protein